MKKYKYSRKEIAKLLGKTNITDLNPNIYETIVDDLLATKEEDKCNHSNDKGIKFCDKCNKYIVQRNLGIKKPELEEIKKIIYNHPRADESWMIFNDYDAKLNELTERVNLLTKLIKK